MVYFIRCELTLAVKIGITFDVGKRMAQLQTACPGKLTLLGSMVGTNAMESEFHQRFSHLRLEGEWFNLTDRDIATVFPQPITRDLFNCLESEFADLEFIISAAVGFEVEIESEYNHGLDDYAVKKTRPGRPRGTDFDASIGVDVEWSEDVTQAAARYVESWNSWLQSGNDPN